MAVTEAFSGIPRRRRTAAAVLAAHRAREMFKVRLVSRLKIRYSPFSMWFQNTGRVQLVGAFDAHWRHSVQSFIFSILPAIRGYSTVSGERRSSMFMRSCIPSRRAGHAVAAQAEGAGQPRRSFGDDLLQLRRASRPRSASSHPCSLAIVCMPQIGTALRYVPIKAWQAPGVGQHAAGRSPFHGDKSPYRVFMQFVSQRQIPVCGYVAEREHQCFSRRRWLPSATVMRWVVMPMAYFSGVSGLQHGGEGVVGIVDVGQNLAVMELEQVYIIRPEHLGCFRCSAAQPALSRPRLSWRLSRPRARQIAPCPLSISLSV